MTRTTHHIAEIDDPTTGESIHLHADTAADLDRLVELTLNRAYPLAVPVPRNGAAHTA